MRVLQCTTIEDAWIQSIKTLDTYGKKESGIKEELNLVIEITDFKKCKRFDKHFRKVFGDERIDYASAYTFIDPREKGYTQIEKGAKWTATYWSRLHNWYGMFNQIEQIKKRLKEHKSAKTIAASVYDPISDGKKVMGGMPCLLSLDFKPRPEGLHITAFFRSMRLSKSGYGDFDAVVALGQYLCEEADLSLHKVTFIAGSGHISTSGDEYKKTKELLKCLNVN